MFSLRSSHSISRARLASTFSRVLACRHAMASGVHAEGWFPRCTAAVMCSWDHGGPQSTGHPFWVYCSRMGYAGCDFARFVGFMVVVVDLHCADVSGGLMFVSSGCVCSLMRFCVFFGFLVMFLFCIVMFGDVSVMFGAALLLLISVGVLHVIVSVSVMVGVIFQCAGVSGSLSSQSCGGACCILSTQSFRSCPVA